HEIINAGKCRSALSWIQNDKRQIDLLSCKLFDFLLVIFTHTAVIVNTLAFPVPPVQITCMINSLVTEGNEKSNAFIRRTKRLYFQRSDLYFFIRRQKNPVG